MMSSDNAKKSTSSVEKHGLERVPLFVTVDDGKGSLAVTLQRITIIRSSQALDCSTELEAVVHVERQEYVLEIGERFACSDHVGSKPLEADVSDAKLELQVVDQVAAIVPYACILMCRADEVVVCVAHVR